MDRYMDMVPYRWVYIAIYRVLYEQGPINCPLNWSFFSLFFFSCGRRNTTARAREGVVVKRI